MNQQRVIRELIAEIRRLRNDAQQTNWMLCEIEEQSIQQNRKHNQEVERLKRNAKNARDE